MSVLVEKLERLELLKKEIKQEEIILQKENEKKRLFELDGTIDKLNIQINEIAKCIDGKIMPNNIHMIHHQMQKDLQKELNMMIKLQNDGVLYGDKFKKVKQKLRKKEIDIRESIGYNTGRNRQGYLVLNENEKFITIPEFINNLNKVDDKTKEFFKKSKNTNNLASGDHTMLFSNMVELNPEQASMNTIVPVFRTIMGIMKKQQKEINQLKSIIASR